MQLPVNGADTGYVLLIADALSKKSVAYLPGEHGGILALVVGDGVHHVGRGYFRFAPANHARLETARLVIPKEKEIIVIAIGKKIK